MKRIGFILIILTLLLAACAAETTPPATATVPAPDSEAGAYPSQPGQAQPQVIEPAYPPPGEETGSEMAARPETEPEPEEQDPYPAQEGGVSEPFIVDLSKLTPEAVTPGAPVEQPAPGVPDAMPKLIQQTKEDLGKRLNLDVSQIEVAEAAAVVWRDGSIGCPKPGMMYTMALVPGFRVLLKVGDEVYHYHASSPTSFIYCDSPVPLDQAITDDGT